jgi:hypothetical protein
MRERTLNIDMRNCSATSSEVSRSSGKGETCVTKRGIYCIVPLRDTVHNQTSYWTDEEIHRMSTDVPFSVVETWWRMQTPLIKDRRERVGEWDLYGFLVINNFERKTASTVGAKSGS